jgi:uncharacterized protein
MSIFTEATVPAPTFLDAQYVVALVNRRDQYHARAVELSRDFTGKPLLTTDVVLIEIGNALARNFRQEAARIIEFFHRAANVEVVPLTAAVFTEAFSLYQARADKSWGMTDCISFVAMSRHGIEEALTSDQHFNQAGFRALPVS